MSLIAMAVHDTDENGKSEYTRKTLESLVESVELRRHRLIIIDNGSCGKTKDLLFSYYNHYGAAIITLPENIGTARAINLAWKQRRPGEHVIKIDNDIIIHRNGWVEEMEAAIAREPLIGQIGLKRNDCIETPWRTDTFKSELMMLPHEPGQRWITVEKSNHVMGSCVMHSAALIDKIGYLWQPGLYGWDDVLMSHRANAAGFITCFLNHIPIDHIDPGGTIYQDWKQQHAGKDMAEINRLIKGYKDGSIPTYYAADGPVPDRVISRDDYQYPA